MGGVGADIVRLRRGMVLSAAAAEAVEGETGLECRADRGERGVGKGKLGCLVEKEVVAAVSVAALVGPIEAGVG